MRSAALLAVALLTACAAPGLAAEQAAKAEEPVVPVRVGYWGELVQAGCRRHLPPPPPPPPPSP